MKLQNIEVEFMPGDAVRLNGNMAGTIYTVTATWIKIIAISDYQTGFTASYDLEYNNGEMVRNVPEEIISMVKMNRKIRPQ